MYLDLTTVVLKAGNHAGPEEGMCVMEAVSRMAGERWSDTPACACPVISALLRQWNDDLPDDATRTRLLAPLIPRLVGSKSTAAVELRRSYLALDWLARECAPAWLSLREDLRPHAEVLRRLAPLVDEQSCAAAQPALTAARDAACDAAVAAAAATRDAARTAAETAAWTTAWAAAWHAARDAACDAAEAGRAAARAAVRDALAPTGAALQQSALNLVYRMLAEERHE